MKRIIRLCIIVAAGIMPLAATAQTAQDLSTSKHNTQSGKEGDIAVGVGNGEVTTFNKFLKEHWNDVEIPEPRLLEKKAQRQDILKHREAKYGTYIRPGNSRQRPSSSKGIGKSSVNRGGGYKRTTRRYDAERDQRLTGDAIQRAEAFHQSTVDLHNMAMDRIRKDQQFQAELDGKELAKKNKEEYAEKMEEKPGMKVNPIAGLINFDEQTYDYEELLRRYDKDPDSLNKEELDHLLMYLDEEIDQMTEEELQETMKQIEEEEQKNK